MSYDQQTQSGVQMMSGLMHSSNMSGAGLPYCNKHEAVINTFCMVHQTPLCQSCVREHLSIFTNIPNTPYGQNGAHSHGSCEIMEMHTAISESIRRMRSSLGSVQDFIDYKKGIDGFHTDASMIQLYQVQNRSFENAYNQALSCLSSLQNMPSGQRELRLGPLNQQFDQELKRLLEARQLIDQMFPQEHQMVSCGPRVNSPIKSFTIGGPGNAQQQAQYLQNHDYAFIDMNPQLLNQSVGQQMSQDLYAGLLGKQGGQTSGSAQQYENQIHSHLQPNQAQNYHHSHQEREQLFNQPYAQIDSQLQMKNPVNAQVAAQQQHQSAQQMYQMGSLMDNKQHQSAAQTSNLLPPNTSNLRHPPQGTTKSGYRPEEPIANMHQRQVQDQPSSGYPYQDQRAQQQAQRNKHWQILLYVTLEFEDTPSPMDMHHGQQNQPVNTNVIQIKLECECSWNLKLLRQRLKEDLIAARAITDHDAQLLEIMKIYLQEGGDGIDSNLHDQRNANIDYINLENSDSTFKELNFMPVTYLLFTMSHIQSSYEQPRRRYSSDERRQRAQMHYQQNAHHGQIGSPTNPAKDYRNGSSREGASHTSNHDGNGHNLHPVGGKVPDRTSPGQMIKGFGHPQEKYNQAEKQGLKKTREDPHPQQKPKSVQKGSNKRETEDQKKPRSQRKPKVVEEKIIYWREADILEPQPVQPEVYNHDEAQEQEESKGGIDNPERGDDQNEPEVKTTFEDKAKDIAHSRVNIQSKVPFDRYISVNPKIRLKMIKRAILEQMGVQDMCVCRLFFHSGQKGEDGSNPVQENPELKSGDELTGEMSTLQQLNLQNGGRVEVQIYMCLDYTVEGKGSGFHSTIELLPSEKMSVIQERISQYRLFARRGYQIFSVALERFFSDEEMENTLMRDTGLNHNSKLVMKLPPKPVQEQEEEEDEDQEGFDEMLDFDEAMDAEGGEDEMIEIEEGEDEMSEPAEDQEDQEDELVEAEEAEKGSQPVSEGEEAAEEEQQ